jgi:hypothetical protein
MPALFFHLMDLARLTREFIRIIFPPLAKMQGF